MTTQTHPPLRFAVASALSIAADASGPDAGIPVLLLHGGGQTRHAWGGTAAALAVRGFRALSLDLRGHGDSGWSPDGRYATELFVADLRAVLRAVDRPAILVGASLGGLTALLAAAADPRPPVLGLALVDVVSRMRPQGIAGIRSFMGRTAAGFDSVEEAAEAVARYLPHRERPKDHSGLLRNLRRRGDGRFHWHWDPAFLTIAEERSDRDAAMEEAARRIGAPVLVLRGERSELVTEERAHAFAGLFADARVRDIPGAHHMVAGDRNDAFTRALLDFVTAIALGETV